jgi:hypothetical protein
MKDDITKVKQCGICGGERVVEKADTESDEEMSE